MGTLEAKLHRSLPMLEREAEEFPDDPRWPMLLARTYRQFGELEKVVEHARRCIQMSEEPRFGRAWVDLALATLRLDGYAAAEAVIAEGLRVHAGMPDLRHTRIAMDAALWMNSCQQGGASYMLAGQESVAHLPQRQ